MAEDYTRTIFWAGRRLSVRVVSGKIRWADVFGGMRQEGFIGLGWALALGIVAHYTGWGWLGLIALLVGGSALIYLVSYLHLMTLARGVERFYGRALEDGDYCPRVRSESGSKPSGELTWIARWRCRRSESGPATRGSGEGQRPKAPRQTWQTGRSGGQRETPRAQRVNLAQSMAARHWL